MKISEFIEYLTSIKEEHGDLDVMECHLDPISMSCDYFPIEEKDLCLDTEYGAPTKLYWYT